MSELVMLSVPLLECLQLDSFSAMTCCAISFLVKKG